MKITDKTMQNSCQFYQLNQGDVFKHAGNTYMKIDNKIVNHVGVECNAVSFDSAIVVYIPKNTIVVKVNAELIISQNGNQSWLRIAM